MSFYNATYQQRVFSCLIDWTLYIVIWNVIIVPCIVFGSEVDFYLGPTQNPWFSINAVELVNSLCLILLETTFGVLIPFLTKGRSIGKKLLGLKILDVNFEDPSLQVIILRYFASRIYPLSFFLLCAIAKLILWCNIHPTIQCLFSKIDNATDQGITIVMGFYILIPLSFLLLVFMAIGNIAIPLMNKDRRALHDLMAQTYVIDELAIVDKEES